MLVVPGVVTEDVPYGAAYELSQKSIREILPAAEEAQVKIGLENVWNKFLLSPLEMRDYIASFNHELDFSIATRDFVPLLTGDIDWPRVMNSLRGSGYNGYITAELSQYTLFHDQMVLDTGTYLTRILDC